MNGPPNKPMKLTVAFGAPSLSAIRPDGLETQAKLTTLEARLRPGT